MADTQKEKPDQVRWVENYKRELYLETLKPVYVQWIATYKCNFHCPHCGTAAGEPLPSELTTHEILKAIDSLSDLGCKIFSVTGGEPLLRDDIFDVLGYAKSKDIMVGVVTNGFETEKYLPQIEKLGLDSVLISIDGYRENHDKIRGTKGSYERCLKSIELYRELNIPMVAVSTVMLPENIDDVRNIIKDAQRKGCINQRIQPLIPEGRAKGTTNDPEIVKEILRIVLEARENGVNIEMSEGFGYLGPLEDIARPNKFFCGCGWNTFTIMENGNVMGCPALDYPEKGEGNIRETDLKDIWWNRFEKFRKTIFEDLPPKCKECKYMEICRGGCWLFRANLADPCFLKEAEEVAREMNIPVPDSSQSETKKAPSAVAKPIEDSDISLRSKTS